MRASYVLLGVSIALLVGALALLFQTRARAADLGLLPPTITNSFGTYTPAYYKRRWKTLCKGGGRYQAMSEAYGLGMPDPCRGRRLE